MHLRLLIASAFVFSFANLAQASDEPAKIADVQVKRDSADQSGIYHFEVTIEHEDKGWDDYLEAWEVFGPDGRILASRPFFKPQPEKSKSVTALTGVIVPEDIETVTIRARTYPVGLEGEPFEVKIPH